MLHVLDLLKIDDAEQTAFVDFALWLAWEDVSLVSPGAGDRFFRPSQIWGVPTFRWPTRSRSRIGEPRS
jgi:hypothetical protein